MTGDEAENYPLEDCLDVVDGFCCFLICLKMFRLGLYWFYVLVYCGLHKIKPTAMMYFALHNAEHKQH